MANKVFPVGGRTYVLEATPTLTVHATYAANDYVGTSTTPISFTSAALAAGYGGWISGAILIDYALQSIATELWLADTTFTTPADSAAWSVADNAKWICVIPFSTYYANVLNSISMGDGLPKKYVCASTSTTLYGALVTRGAPTYASGDLTVRLFVDYD